MSNVRIISQIDRAETSLHDMVDRESAEARERFIKSQAVREHIERQHHGNATLVFSDLAETSKPEPGERSRSLDAIAAEAEAFPRQPKDESAKFRGYQNSAEQKTIANYGQGNDKAFGGYLGNRQPETGDAAYLQGNNSEKATCSGCGCGFAMSDKGEISQSSTLPGQEGSSKGYGGLGKQQGTYGAVSGTQGGYNTSSSSKVRYT